MSSYLIHYGTKNSGRYPRGSGENPNQRDGQSVRSISLNRLNTRSGQQRATMLQKVGTDGNGNDIVRKLDRSNKYGTKGIVKTAAKRGLIGGLATGAVGLGLINALDPSALREGKTVMNAMAGIGIGTITGTAIGTAGAALMGRYVQRHRISIAKRAYNAGYNTVEIGNR